MSETMTYAQLERMVSAETGIDYARERRENADAMRLCDELEEHDYEAAADEFELIAHKDWRGVPIEGHESPRYFGPRERAYRAWLLSAEGARTRRNAHPELEGRLRRAGHVDEPASFAARDEER